jgi:hypothetical protein
MRLYELLQQKLQPGAVLPAPAPSLTSNMERTMTKATNDHTLKTAPSRRAMLTGSGALLAGVTGFFATPGASTGTPSPDAELIALCGKYAEMESYLGEKYAGEDIDPDDPLLDEITIAVEKIGDFRASTLPGFVARAKAIAFYAPDLLDTERTQGEEERMVAALLRDLVGEVRA